MGVGFAARRLAHLETVLSKRFVEPGLIPGAQILIWRSGELVLDSVVGAADREGRQPLRHDAIFRIFSMTKPITCVVVMMLVEAGLITLDQSVAELVAGWDRLTVLGAQDAVANVRILDLLRHTSGLTYHWANRTAVDQAYRSAGISDYRLGIDLDSVMDRLASAPLEFEPGRHWNYSISVDVLGHIIERVTGKPLDQVFAEWVFRPLGMSDTGFSCPGEHIDRLPPCYVLAQDGQLALFDEAGAASEWRLAPTFRSAGGGLVSTGSDYLKFCRMLLGGGSVEGIRILGPKTVELMTMNQLPGGRLIADMQAGPTLGPDPGYGGQGFGLGFAVTVDLAKCEGYASVGDYSWAGAASTLFWVDPAEEMIVVFLTQVIGTDYGALRRDLRTLVYSALDRSLAH